MCDCLRARFRHSYSCTARAQRRVGQVAVAGTYASATVAASGTGSVYVSGVTSSVTATVSGIGNLFVQAANRAPLTPVFQLSSSVCGYGKHVESIKSAFQNHCSNVHLMSVTCCLIWHISQSQNR